MAQEKLRKTALAHLICAVSDDRAIKIADVALGD